MFLAGSATGGLALTAGCLDFVLGNGPLKFEADQVAPPQSTLDDTEYEDGTIGEETIEETVEARGIERDVRATYWVSTYMKDVEYDGEQHEGSLFAAVSVPAMEFAGRSLNPLDDQSNEKVLEEFLGQVESEGSQIENIEHDESFTLTILDDVRDVDVFVGETEFAGERVDVDIRMTSFDHEDDLIVLLGSHPKLLADEGATIEELMESVVHPA